MELQITTIYLELLGRGPTPEELQSGLDLSREGITEQGLRNMISAGEEARINIENLLRTHLGQVHPQSLRFWLRSLAQSKGLHEIAHHIREWSSQ
jgi:hypothetical protein